MGATTTMMMMMTIIPTTLTLRTILQGPSLTTLLSRTTLPVMMTTGVTQAAQEVIVRVNTTTTTGIGSTFLDLLPPAPATQAKVERPRVANQDRRGGRATRTGIITMMTMMTTIMGTHHIMALVMDPVTTLDTTLVAMVMTTGATVTHHAQDMAMMTTGATQALTRL